MSREKTFSDEIIVELTNSLPGTEFRYTTNGSLPTASSTLYTGPIAVSTTTQIRAMALYAEYIPSEINTETYIQLGTDLTDYDNSGQPFRTQVPLVIFDTFGQSINRQWVSEYFVFAFRTDKWYGKYYRYGYGD